MAGDCNAMKFGEKLAAISDLRYAFDRALPGARPLKCVFPQDLPPGRPTAPEKIALVRTPEEDASGQPLADQRAVDHRHPLTAVGKWPKRLPVLTAEQERVRDDFMAYWHEVLPNRYGVIERFNHGWPAKTARPGERTLEIGAGLGEHLGSEPEFARADYAAVELRPEMAAVIAERHPGVEVVVGDCQRADAVRRTRSFDRVLAIHVLEHLPDLPAALAEIRRLLKPTGRLVVVIPCEGGLAYSLARRISAQRIFEKRYGMSYDFFIESEHINVPREIVEECGAHFEVVRRRYFPLVVPLTAPNLVIGLELTPLAG